MERVEGLHGEFIHGEGWGIYPWRGLEDLSMENLSDGGEVFLACGSISEEGREGSLYGVFSRGEAVG